MRLGVFFLFVLVFSSPVLSSDFSDGSVKAPQQEFFEPFISGLADSDGNLRRLKYIERQLDEMGLMPITTRQWIDWYTLQRNVIIDIPGDSDRLVYVVAHYDKADMNPLKVATIMLNGMFDEVVGVTYLSDGATDNGTGVSVALALANQIRSQPRHFSYRILLTGAEESGLRGARAHLAKLSKEEKQRIHVAINIDTVGLKDSDNCVSIPVSDDVLVVDSLEIAMSQGYTLKQGVIPAGASADYAAFRKQNFLYDFGRGLMFNLPGGLLPQRSWFTSSHRAKVMNFTACKAIDAWDYVAGTILLPTGKIHGPRDTLNKIDYQRLFEQYHVIQLLLDRIEARAVQ